MSFCFPFAAYEIRHSLDLALLTNQNGSYIVNNPVPASTARFQQFRVIERFCVEGSNKRSDHGHSSNDLEFFTDRIFRASFSNFRKLINAFHFFPLNNGRGGLTSGLAWGLASVKSGPEYNSQI